MTQKPHIAFIGLGVMGFPMAGHFANAGYSVRVFNRTASRAKSWQQHYSGEAFVTPAEAAADADIICICVGNDDDVRSVFYGENGILSRAKKHSIVVDHTTTSAELAEELDAACATQNVHFIDAPVSGGQQGAQNGQLTIMCGGSESAFQSALPHLSVYAKQCMRIGPAGSGQKTKMVNQICIAGLLQGLAEGMLFAEKAGLDRQQVIDVISQGAAQSWQMNNRHKTMIAGEYHHGFAIDWMIKDLQFCLDEAQKLGLSLQTTEQVLQFYREMQQQGHGRWDTSCLYARLQQRYP